MADLLIKGGLVVTPREERFVDIWTSGDKIAGLGAVFERGFEVIDAGGCYVTPGLVDLQVNGGTECDFWSCPSLDQVKRFSASLLRNGVTSILPTLITGDMKQMSSTRDFLQQQCFAGSVQQPVEQLVRMPGIHLEGPFLSPHRPGVHPPEYVQPLRVDLLQQLINPAVRLITLAPEGDPSGKAVQWLKEQDIVVAIGHSNATLEEALQSFDCGVTLMTHTFNALPPLHHRDPGAVAAALLDERIKCCMICDGLHLNPAAARLIHRCKGTAGTILVTDIAAIGTSKGGLAGASIFLNEAVQNTVKWGITNFSRAVCMASFNPAAALGLQSSIGSLSAGAYADLVLWDTKSLEIKQVIFNGRPVKQ